MEEKVNVMEVRKVMSDTAFVATLPKELQDQINQIGRKCCRRMNDYLKLWPEVKKYIS